MARTNYFEEYEETEDIADLITEGEEIAYTNAIKNKLLNAIKIGSIRVGNNLLKLNYIINQKTSIDSGFGSLIFNNDEFYAGEMAQIFIDFTNKKYKFLYVEI